MSLPSSVSAVLSRVPPRGVTLVSSNRMSGCLSDSIDLFRSRSRLLFSGRQRFHRRLNPAADFAEIRATRHFAGYRCCLARQSRLRWRDRRSSMFRKSHDPVKWERRSARSTVSREQQDAGQCDQPVLPYLVQQRGAGYSEQVCCPALVAAGEAEDLSEVPPFSHLERFRLYRVGGRHGFSQGGEIQIRGTQVYDQCVEAGLANRLRGRCSVRKRSRPGVRPAEVTQPDQCAARSSASPTGHAAASSSESTPKAERPPSRG